MRSEERAPCGQCGKKTFVEVIGGDRLCSKCVKELMDEYDTDND